MNSTEQNDDIQQRNQEKIDQLQKASKPLWLTRQFVDRPCRVLIVCSIIFFLCLVLTSALKLFKQTEQTDREWMVWSSDQVTEYDIHTLAMETFERESDNQDTPIRSEKMSTWDTILILECYEECSNVLTAKYFNLLLQAERKIKAMKKYPDFCFASTTDPACDPNSFISLSNLLTDDQKEKGVIQQDLNQILNNILDDEMLYQQVSFLFGKEFKKGNPKTKYLRTIISFGSPIELNGKKMKNKYDKEEEQEEAFVEYSEDMIDLVDNIEKSDGDGKITILFFSQATMQLFFDQVVDKDFLWALASITFVWAYLTFHLKSFFLSSFAMFGILISFPITITIVKLILRVEYFATLHILVVFIVLGIAADDIFVFIDAWEQTANYDFLAEDLNKRMAVTFKRSARAMLATSSTTSAAFLATGFSKQMPISSFGIFAGILIPVNYILVITFFPALLIIYLQKFEKCCQCKKKNKNNDQELQKIPSEDSSPRMGTQLKTESDQVVMTQQAQDTERVLSSGQNSPTLHAAPLFFQKQESKAKEVNKVEQFFEGKYNDFIVKAKYPIIGIFVVWTIIAMVLALHMGPLTKPDQWLPESFELQRAIDHLGQDFIQGGESNEVIKVKLLFGLKGISRDGTNSWDATDVGRLIWDGTFDLSPPANQEYLLKFCEDLEKNKLVLDGVVRCFMPAFKEFIENQGLTFPVEEIQFQDKLEEFTESAEGLEYYIANDIGLFHKKLNYVNIEVVSIGKLFGNYKNKIPIYEDWEDFVKISNKNAPSGLKNLRQSSEVWARFVTFQAFISQALEGMFISLTFALIVLILSTHNIIVSLYSIFSITGIVASVVTVMYLSGWQLGVAESITIVILIGFSVDYVVHLANHYVESSYPDKFRRTQEALKEIGISIISGSITTLGSGIFLFFAVITIFYKFAVLIVSTICFSLMYSLLFFVAMMHAFGPQEDTGNLVVWFKKIRGKSSDRVVRATYLKKEKKYKDNEEKDQKIDTKQQEKIEMKKENQDQQQFQKIAYQDEEKKEQLDEEYQQKEKENQEKQQQQQINIIKKDDELDVEKNIENQQNEEKNQSIEKQEDQEQNKEKENDETQQQQLDIIQKDDMDIGKNNQIIGEQEDLEQNKEKQENKLEDNQEDQGKAQNQENQENQNEENKNDNNNNHPKKQRLDYKQGFTIDSGFLNDSVHPQQAK